MLKKNLISWMLTLLLAIAMVFIVQKFIGKIYNVNHNGMLYTLVEGDRVWLNKLPGQRLSRGTVVAYKANRRKDISRCVALPGDTIRLKAKRLFVNRRLQPLPDGASFAYQILAQPQHIDNLRNQGFYENAGDSLHGFVAQFFLARNQKRHLDTILDWQSASLIKFAQNISQKSIFPFQRNLFWNEDFLGPLIVPKKGMTIELTVSNYYSYTNLLQKYEDVELTYNDGFCKVDGRVSTNYTFTRDYLALMYDKRAVVRDSLFFQIIPRDYLLGTIDYCLYSTNSENRPVNRGLFRQID